MGAGDLQYLQSPVDPLVPNTGTIVFQLFEQLGIHTVLTLFTAIMTEHKVLIHSQSFSRLHDACQALISLMYPFKYSHVYIPLLPMSLTEVLNIPTPFLIGCHSKLKSEFEDALLETIIVDLDCGALSLPDVSLPSLDKITYNELVNQLCLIIKPQSVNADLAFGQTECTASPTPPPHLLDKEIRAIFLRFIAQVLQSYRNFLQVVRIFPKPFITFNKTLFLGSRNLVENEFTVKLINSMFFNTFIQERGLPYRYVDLFDNLFASINDTLIEEEKNPSLFIRNIRALAGKLLDNEFTLNTNNPDVQVLSPSKEAIERSESTVFPAIDKKCILEKIENETIKKEMTQSLSAQQKSLTKQLVPFGAKLNSISSNESTIMNNSAKRLEVMKNCITCIFENRITDARKTFPAVLRALKNKFARLALAQELLLYTTNNGGKVVLEHEQFDLVVRLMNSALQQDIDYLNVENTTATGLSTSELADVNGLATAILPLSRTFCRRLNTGIEQFAYSCVQDHSVWSKMSFWESAFYTDAERDLVALYGLTKSQVSEEDYHQLVLEKAAEQMQLAETLSEEAVKERSITEESTVYSQAIHYSSHMVYLKIPLDVCNKVEKLPNRQSKHLNHLTDGHSDSNSNLTGTVTRRDSFLEARELDNESGYEEGSNGRMGSNSEKSLNVIRYVDRFIDKVAIEAGINEDHIKSLHGLVPTLVVLQCEANDQVYKESKKLPPITKSKLIAPYLLPGEKIVSHGLRAYLVDSCRDEVIDSSYTESITNGNMVIDSIGSSMMPLPAEGGLFLTNYRIIFRGKSWDPLASENCIVRFFPIATLCKEKRISFPSHTFASIDQYLTEGLQLRSNAFQAFKIAFDEEVTSDEIEHFCKALNKTRLPSSLFLLFAFTSQSPASNQIELLTMQSKKDKGGTLRFAKRTLLRTVERTGINVNRSKKNKDKLMLPNLSGSKTMLHTSKTPMIAENDERFNDSASIKSDSSHLYTTNSSIVQNEQVLVMPTIYREKDSRTLRKLIELPYVRDYQRLQLGSSKILVNSQSSTSNGLLTSPTKQSQSGKEFRISMVNINYSVSQSYPAFVVVPANLNDESIKKLSKCYKSQRFPAIVWRHPKKKSLLIRASAFHGKGVISLFKSHGPTSNMSSNLANMSSGNPHDSHAFEQEKYFKSILNLMPDNSSREHNNSYSASINSLELTAISADLNTPTKELKMSQQNHAMSPFLKAYNTLRTSGGKSGLGTIGQTMGKRIQKWNNKLIHQDSDTNSLSSTVTSMSQNSQSLIRTTNNGDSLAGSTIGSLGLDNKSVNFYIFGEKVQIKSLKIEQFPSSCAFVPVDVHEIKQIKQSFKKLLKICCPLSKSKTETKHGFYHQIESTGWFKQLQTILALANEMVDVVDYKGCSAMLCLEESADIVPQIVSIAELCLDPYYRTFNGFRVLVEKEWLAFGHRFSHRSNQVGQLGATVSSSFAPIFLQFLDLVHQIMNQYQLSFEFNQYYLKFIAYHYISCRFRTFLLDCEAERAEYGWIYEDLRKTDDEFDFINGRDLIGNQNARLSEQNSHLSKSAQTYLDSGINFIGTSFWDYTEQLWEKSSIFFNFYYVAASYLGGNSSDEKNPCVLRPKINLNNFRVWDYYLNEELSHGPSYDVEMVAFEKQRREEQEATTVDAAKSKESKRIIVNPINENVAHFQPNGIEEMLETHCSLEAELGKGVGEKNWYQVWDKIEIPMLSTTNLNSSVSDKKSLISNQILRRYNNINMHAINNFLLANQKVHRFEKFTSVTTVACDYCKMNLFDMVKTGLRCRECGYSAHERCYEAASKTKCLGNSMRSFINPSMDQDDENSVHSESIKIDNNNLHQHYKQFMENSLDENQTYAGYLFKRGALLKHWKQSWFVLDSIKHQLRYYESKESRYSKGFIDLAEVVSVSPQASYDNNLFEVSFLSCSLPVQSTNLSDFSHLSPVKNHSSKLLLYGTGQAHRGRLGGEDSGLSSMRLDRVCDF